MKIYKVEFARTNQMADYIQPIYFQFRADAESYAVRNSNDFYICQVQVVLVHTGYVK